MSRRTTEAYSTALEYLHQNLIPLVGNGIIIDFEKAMRSALHNLNTGINILGCWFHFCQALRRKMASVKLLFEIIRTDHTAKDIFRRIQCLALLPPDQIQPAFINLSREGLKHSENFSEFIDYFYDEWILRVKPQHFSVFLRNVRTTASAESFNGKSNKLFRTHGNFFHFCEVLQKEEVTKVEQLENEINGTIQRNNQKIYYKKRSEVIKEYSQRLEEKQISTSHFLKIMANPKNAILFTDGQISIHDIEVDLAINTELSEGVDQSEIHELSYRAVENDFLEISIEMQPGNVEDVVGFVYYRKSYLWYKILFSATVSTENNNAPPTSSIDIVDEENVDTIIAGDLDVPYIIVSFFGPFRNSDRDMIEKA